MLQVKNLTITQSRDLRTLVDNLSFHLRPGDKMAIISVSHDRLYLIEVCHRVLRFTPQGLVEEDTDLYL